MPRDEAIEASFDLPEGDRITLAGQRPGTPLYMAPEQIRGTPPVDERSDIFSFGVMLYECLVQREPFRGKSIDETFKNILHHTPPPPSTIRSELKNTPIFDEICSRALSKNSADRYQSAGELMAVLQRGRNQLLKRDAD